jgi:hypothetical protein
MYDTDRIAMEYRHDFIYQSACLIDDTHDSGSASPAL